MPSFRTVCNDLLCHIILCDVLTAKGRRSRDKLQADFDLDASKITKEYFFSNLYANPRYGEDFVEDIDDDSEIAAEQMFQKESELEFRLIKDHLQEFHDRLWSRGIDNQSIFLIQGVAGNGKTIWIMHELYERLKNDEEFENNCSYFSMDDLPSATVTYGNNYYIPDSSSVIELLVAKLLEGIMKYIRNTDNVGLIQQNYRSYIKAKGLHSDEWKMDDLFSAIGAYRRNNYITEQKIFNGLKYIIDFERNDAISRKEREDTRVLGALVKILCFIMFCSDPHEMNYIVFDNIEFFINIGDQCIQIYDEDIYTLTETIYKTVKDIIRDFNYRLKEEVGENNNFKVIMIVRRTSLQMLFERLHSPELDNRNIVDITGSARAVDIWNQKKCIWYDFIEKQCSVKYPNYAKWLIEMVKFADFVMGNGEGTVGKSYQHLIEPLMSYGIRRSALAECHAIVDSYIELKKNENQLDTIGFTEFEQLKSDLGWFNKFTQYMFRRSLMEFHFRWIFTSRKMPQRWRDLGIGHLVFNEFADRTIPYNDIKFMGTKINEFTVRYLDPLNISMLRRVLSFLSYYPNEYTINRVKSVEKMFEKVALSELIKGIMVYPKRHVDATALGFFKIELRALARVLIALANMRQKVTKGAPFIILEIRDERFCQSQDIDKLVDILIEQSALIWSDGEETRKYVESSSNYQVRITDAGYAFLMRWLPSYSFMSALYCCKQAPLFYQKNPVVIKYIIKKVYDSVSDLCTHYEDEAMKFCEGDISGFFSEEHKYLPQSGSKKLSFKEQVKEYHIEHLGLYKSYIHENFEKMNISENEAADVEKFISDYKEKYKRWKVSGSDFVCF